MKISASSGTATVTLNGHVGNSQNNFLIPEGTTGYSEVTAKAFENIAPPVTLLTFPTDNNFNRFEVGDVVQTGDWNQSQEWASLIQGNLNTADGTNAAGLFNGVIGTNYTEGVTPVDGQSLSINFGSTFTSATSITISGYANNVAAGNNVLKINGTSVAFSAVSTSNQTYPLSSGLQSLEWSYDTAGANGYIYLTSITVDGNLLVDTSVPNPDAASITAIDDTVPSIATKRRFMVRS